MRLAIGIDIGGSHISGGVVNIDSGQLIVNSYKELKINTQSAGLQILIKWCELVKEVMGNRDISEIEGVGFAMPGPFDYEGGISEIKGVDKYDLLFGVNVKQFVSTYLKLDAGKIFFENDASCFALGEYWSGTAKEENKILAITLGTGFGSTFIEKGEVLKTGKGVPEGGYLYNQLFADSIADNYFSTRWFENEFKKIFGEEIEGVRAISDRAINGDLGCKSLFSKFGDNLSLFLGTYIKDFSPQAIVLGGGVAKSWDLISSSFYAGLKRQGVNFENVYVSEDMDKSAIAGAVCKIRENIKEMNREIRKTSQFLMPEEIEAVSKGKYDIYPGFPVKQGSVKTGFESLVDELLNSKQIIIDGYVGVLWEDVKQMIGRAFENKGKRVVWTEVKTAMKSSEEIERLIEAYMGGDDPIFGTRCDKSLADFFNEDDLYRLKPQSEADVNIIIGCGAALAKWEGPLVYIDLPKNELQFRMRAGKIMNLGASKLFDNKTMYKRFYFVDWVLLNKHKQELLPVMDYVVDEQRPYNPFWMSAKELRDALENMGSNFFRVRPWFEPGPWGGTWMKDNISQLSQDVPNYAWSFEMIVPENGLLLKDGLKMMEVSFDMLMFQAKDKVLGRAAKRFGVEFPIRFDYLDTFDGGNLSVQCHPRTDYIKKEFGENFTQDETYYILETKNNAQVYLGFQEDINADEFKKVLENSFQNGVEVDIDKYVLKHPAHKHDLFLIPNGTIHGSGTDNLVLEISSTPYIFTFKMYDWLRLDLEGKPRPLNIDRAFENLYFDRKGKHVSEEFISKPYLLEVEGGGRVIHQPTHPEHFYDVHRLEFEKEMKVKTNEQCHIMMLVEGTSIILETKNGMRQRFNYAETFVVPAGAEEYLLINEGDNVAKVVKAFVKDECC